MRVGIDVSILEDPRWTGVERYLAGLVEGAARLRRRPNHRDLAAHPPGGDPPAPVGGGRDLRGEPRRRREVPPAAGCCNRGRAPPPSPGTDLLPVRRPDRAEEERPVAVARARAP